MSATDQPASLGSRASSATRSSVPWWRRLDLPGALATLGVPLMAFVFASQLLFMAAVATNVNPIQGETWAHWDSNLYLTIARGGYELPDCAPPAPDGVWCGNAGWFPGYPALIALFGVFGAPLRGTGVLISWAFSLASLVLVWTTFLARRVTPTNIACLTFVAFAPGAVYQRAVFPISMLVFFTLLALWWMSRERWLAAGLAGAAAATAYPLGVLLAPVSGLWILLDARRAGWRRTLRRLAATSVVTALGALLVVVVMRLQTGYWDAYFKNQAGYNHERLEPFTTWWSLVRGVFSAPVTMGTVATLQAVLVGVVVLVVLLHMVVRWRRVTRVDILLALFVVVTWLFPLAQTNVGLYRSNAALVPLALLTRRLPIALQGLIVGAFVSIAFPIAMLFFSNILV